MHKVGLLTFHRSYNCGSLLQAFALQKILTERYGLDSEFINFSNDNQRQLYSVFPRPKKIRHIFRNLMFVPIAHRIRRHNKNFESFINKYLIVSDGDYRNKHDLQKNTNDYCAFIVGSDQIWNTKCADADDAYFLNFTDAEKKYAYAVSFGANNIVGLGKEKEEYYSSLINSFKILSVREDNAVKWVKELTGRDSVIAADPTLLLEKKDYDALSPDRYVKEKYIFFYSFGYDKYASEIVAKYSKKLGIPVYVIDAKQWIRKKLFKYGFRLTKDNGPEVFISLIRDAEFVFTTSLHGTAFSSIFQKNFWYLTEKRPEDMQQYDDDRALSMLKHLGLTDRFVTEKMLEKTDISSNIDFEILQRSKEILVTSSLMLLDKMVEDINR